MQQTTQKLIKSLRGVSKECSICQKKFELFQREHICKRCLRSVCSSCSPKKIIIVDYDLKPQQKHRICNICKSENKFQKHFRKENELQFGKTSPIALRWLQSLNIIQSTENQHEILELEETYNQAKSKDLISNINITKMKKHLNYSFKQFAYQVQGKETSDQEVSIKLVNLLNKLAYKLEWQTLPHKFHCLAYFFLSIASESQAYHLLVDIYSNYIPNYVIEFNQFNSSPERKLTSSQKIKIKKIQNYLTIQNKQQEYEQNKIFTFLKDFGLELISSLYVDDLSVESFYISIDKMITNNTFMELERILIRIIRHHIDFIKKSTFSSKEEYQYISQYLIRNTNLNNFNDGEDIEESRSENNQQNESIETQIFKRTSISNNINTSSDDGQLIHQVNKISLQQNIFQGEIIQSQSKFNLFSIKEYDEIQEIDLNKSNEINFHQCTSAIQQAKYYQSKNTQINLNLNTQGNNIFNEDITESYINDYDQSREEKDEWSTKNTIQYETDSMMNKITQNDSINCYEQDENIKNQSNIVKNHNIILHDSKLNDKKISYNENQLNQEQKLISKDLNDEQLLKEVFMKKINSYNKINNDEIILEVINYQRQLVEKDKQLQEKDEKINHYEMLINNYKKEIASVMELKFELNKKNNQIKLLSQEIELIQERYVKTEQKLQGQTENTRNKDQDEINNINSQIIEIK